jgi:hypothetical protein
MKPLLPPLAISSVMLLVALYPGNPYGYYVILRIVCCACFAYLAFRLSSFRQDGWVWIFAVLAIIYNPIFRIGLSRNIWTAVNIASIAVNIFSFFMIKIKGEKDI